MFDWLTDWLEDLFKLIDRSRDRFDDALVAAEDWIRATREEWFRPLDLSGEWTASPWGPECIYWVLDHMKRPERDLYLMGFTVSEVKRIAKAGLTADQVAFLRFAAKQAEWPIHIDPTTIRPPDARAGFFRRLLALPWWFGRGTDLDD